MNQTQKALRDAAEQRLDAAVANLRAQIAEITSRTGTMPEFNSIPDRRGNCFWEHNGKRYRNLSDII